MPMFGRCARSYADAGGEYGLRRRVMLRKAMPQERCELSESDVEDAPVDRILSRGLRDRGKEERDARAKKIDEQLAAQGPGDAAEAWRRVLSYLMADVEGIVDAVAKVQVELTRQKGGLSKGPEVAAERRKKDAKERELKIEQEVAKLFTRNPPVLNKQIAAHLDEHQVAILGKKFYEPTTMLEFAKKIGAKQRASLRAHKK